MPRLIALDIGSHAVKVSSYRISGRHVDLDDRYYQPVPQDGTPPTVEAQLVALEALLEDESRAKPQAGDTVVVAYPSSRASFHRVTLPFTERSQIASTLPFTIEEEVPFDLDEMVLGWRVAGRSEAGTDVVAVLARHEQLQEWIAALAEQGTDPAVVHVDADVYGPWGGLETDEPIAFAEEFSDSTQIAVGGPLVAVVDIGHAHSTVTVVQDGIAQLCRSISVGGLAFTRAVQQGLGCEWSEAEARKHADDPLPEQARRLLDQAVQLLLAELRSTLIKAEDVLGAEVLEVRVTGGSSALKGLTEQLANDLGVPVRRAQDPSGDAAPGTYGLSAALAWSSVPGVHDAVDMRIGDLHYRGGASLVRAALTYGVAGAVFFTLAATVMFAYQFFSLSAEQRKAEAEVFEIVERSAAGEGAGEVETLSMAKALMAGVTEDAAQLAAVVGDGGGVPFTIDTLYHLTQAFPPHPEVRVELSDLTITRSNISFNAETDNFNSSASVEMRLQASERFRTATKGQEKRLSNGRVRFPITITLGEAAVDAEEG